MRALPRDVARLYAELTLAVSGLGNEEYLKSCLEGCGDPPQRCFGDGVPTPGGNPGGRARQGALPRPRGARRRLDGEAPGAPLRFAASRFAILATFFAKLRARRRHLAGCGRCPPETGFPTPGEDLPPSRRRFVTLSRSCLPPIEIGARS
jgi:hypothetical protein